jgi:predicted Zn-dependent protease
MTEDVLELAHQAEEHGHFDEAVALHQGLINRYPHNPVIWRSLADLNYRARRQSEAVQAYDRALQEGLINPELEQWLKKYRSQP